MPRGYTSIIFKGGKRDGEVIDDVSLRNLPDTLSFKSENYFAITSSGDMRVRKGELNSQWNSYVAEIYTKAANEKHTKGTVFEFLETIEVERCSAITKKNTECLKPSLHHKNYCCETHKPKKELK